MDDGTTSVGISMRSLLLVAALACTVAAAGCRREKPESVSAAEVRPVAVKTIPVTSETFTATIAVTGTLVSSSRVDVKAETTGRIVRFPKEQGDRVQAGESVAWVDDENYRLALRQSESAVQVAQAALHRAKVMEAHTEAELERSHNLVKSGGITERDLRAAEVAEKDARAQVALASAQLDQAVSAAEVARKRLRDAVILAPVSGVIQEKHVNTGAYVEPPTTVFSLVDNSRLELRSPVPAAEMGPIRTGQQVLFSVSSFPGVEFSGRVVELAPAVDEQSRAAHVRIQIANSEGRLRAGMFADGEIITGARPNTVVIPGSAIYREDQSRKDSYVFVAAAGKAVKRDVRIGREKGTLVEIVEGLAPGDILIAERSVELADGVPIQQSAHP